MQTNLLQDVSGPFLYGTLNRRPQMTLPRPRSDRLGSETSSITNHIDLPIMTSSISAYNNNTGMSGQDIWTPMAVHHSHPGHGAQCGGGYQMPGTVGNGGPGNGSVASSLRSESPISSGKTFKLHRYCAWAIMTRGLCTSKPLLEGKKGTFKEVFSENSAFMDS